MGVGSSFLLAQACKLLVCSVEVYLFDIPKIPVSIGRGRFILFSHSGGAFPWVPGFGVHTDFALGLPYYTTKVCFAFWTWVSLEVGRLFFFYPCGSNTSCWNQTRWDLERRSGANKQAIGSSAIL